MSTATNTDLLRAPSPARNALGGLTVVLACLDEAENLPDAVRHATQAAERCAVTHEIIIVDDAIAARDSRVRLVVHAENRGYGAALRSGIAAARMPWVLLTDGDLQFDFDDLEDFLPLAQSADLVVGWRILPQGPVGERVEGALWNRFLCAAFGLPVRDVGCAFRLARRELLQSLDLRASGPLVGAELLVKSRIAGARAAEAPVHHKARVAGRHSGSGRRLSARTLRELADLRRALRNRPGHA
jgi:glycosyltransferase involved in cell wall biosynthesis